MTVLISHKIRVYLNKISAYLRHSKLEPIKQALQSGSFVIDIGVWTSMPEPHPAENWLEKQGVGQGKLIAVGLDDMGQFKKKYPNVLCVQANGCALPFRDDAADIVFANAVLEHVPELGQTKFVFEVSRIARKWAMVAVPDRFSPLEVHSRIPVLHWLPSWRYLFRLIGEEFWASPDNLSSIFTKSSLVKLIKDATGDDGLKWTVERQTLFGIPVSLIAKHKKSVKETI